MNIRWILQTAARQILTVGRSLSVFFLVLAMGVSTITLSRSLSEVFASHLAAQERSYLGADGVLTTRQQEDIAILENLLTHTTRERSYEQKMRTMVRFPLKESSSFVILRGLDPSFPFNTTPQTEPPGIWSKVLTEQNGVLIDQSLALQRGVEIGEEIAIGNLRLKVLGTVIRMPGDVGFSSLFAPKVYIARGLLPATGLIQKGSIVDNHLYLVGKEKNAVIRFLQDSRATLERLHIESSTAREKNESLGRVLSRVEIFFSSIGTLSLLIGISGVALAVQLFLRQRVRDVGIVCCLGAKRREAIAVVVLPLLILGGLSISLGSFGGALLSVILSTWLEKILPGVPQGSFSIQGVGEGIMIGISALTLSILPLLPPMTRGSGLDLIKGRESTKGIGAFSLGGGVILGVVLILLGESLRLVCGALAALVFFGICGTALRALARRFRIALPSFMVRFGISSLYRPGNQTVLLMSAFGLITFLLSMGLIAKEGIQGLLESAQEKERPTLYAFDVQSDQKEDIIRSFQKMQYAVSEVAPVVLMKLSAIKGVPISEILSAPGRTIPEWALTRDYWSTYRGTVASNEKILEGTWISKKTEESTRIPVSIDKRLGERLGLSLGDTLDFNLQGIELQSYVSSIREIQWEKLQRNSFLVFPEGVLEDAPQFFVLGSSGKSLEEDAALIKNISEHYPSVSIMEVRSIVAAVQEIVEKLEKALYGGIGIISLCALTVFIGTLLASKRSRAREGALLRVIGARSMTLMGVGVVEALLIGSIALVTGVLMASACAALLVVHTLDVPFVIPWREIVVLLFSELILLLLVSLFGVSKYRHASSYALLREAAE